MHVSVRAHALLNPINTSVLFPAFHPPMLKLPTLQRSRVTLKHVGSICTGVKKKYEASLIYTPLFTSTFPFIKSCAFRWTGLVPTGRTSGQKHLEWIDSLILREESLCSGSEGFRDSVWIYFWSWVCQRGASNPFQFGGQFVKRSRTRRGSDPKNRIVKTSGVKVLRYFFTPMMEISKSAKTKQSLL